MAFSMGVTFAYVATSAFILQSMNGLSCVCSSPNHPYGPSTPTGAKLWSSPSPNSAETVPDGPTTGSSPTSSRTSPSVTRTSPRWATHDIALRGSGSKTLHHPQVGTLVLDWEILASALDPDLQIVLWTAAPGSATHDRLRQLAAL